MPKELYEELNLTGQDAMKKITGDLTGYRINCFDALYRYDWQEQFKDMKAEEVVGIVVAVEIRKNTLEQIVRKN